jgi:anti-sigma factor RsiW
MTCNDALELVEPIAAADLEVTPALRDHFETCPRCAAALASARRLEMELTRRETPVAPERFTTTVLQRIRREQWRTEQNVDRLFNVAIAAALVLMFGGLAALLNLNGVLSMAASVWTLLTGVGRTAVGVAAPSLGMYVAAAGLLLSALAMWWWADHSLEF